MSGLLSRRELAARQATSTDSLVAALARAEQRLDCQKRRLPPIGSRISFQRLRDFERYLSWYWGSILQDDDAGRDDLHILLSICKACGHGWENAQGFIRKWAPWATAEEATAAYENADLKTAYLKADELAQRLGVTYAIRQLLRLQTIGATDIPKAEREKMRRSRYGAKRRKAKAKAKPEFKPREAAILKMVGAGINMGDLARKASRSPLFRGREDTPRNVRKIVDRLVKAGHLDQSLVPREGGRPVYYVLPKSKTRETPNSQALLEKVL